MLRVLTLAALFASPALLWAANRQDPAAGPAQVQNSSPATASQPAPAPKIPKPKPKKVWTDDNLGEIRGTISVVGNPQNAYKGQAAQSNRAKPAAGKSPDAVDPKTLAAAREKLQKLQSDLAIVDQQLSALKGFSKGEQSGSNGMQANTWQYDSSSVEEQIRRIEDKKTKLQGTIDDLLDAARAAGIEPGQLR
ncbi:MAG: hypothetical protein ABSH13_14070 [Candidatus Acidiferrum sp.]|jgi:hypothetical protein